MIMKDGVRKCWKENNGKQPEYPNCEHWSWEGKTIMINTNNQELFEIPKENFKILLITIMFIKTLNLTKM